MALKCKCHAHMGYKIICCKTFYLKLKTLNLIIVPSQTKLLKKASSMLVAEYEEKKRDRVNTLNERVPPLKLSGLSVQELQVLNNYTVHPQSSNSWKIHSLHCINAVNYRKKCLLLFIFGMVTSTNLPYSFRTFVKIYITRLIV